MNEYIDEVKGSLISFSTGDANKQDMPEDFLFLRLLKR